MIQIFTGLLFVAVVLSSFNPECLASPPIEQGPHKVEPQTSLSLSRPPLDHDMQIVMVQMALGTFGFLGGPFDGIWTLETQRAMNVYQKIRGLTLTKDLEWTTVEAILKDLDEWRAQPVFPPFMKMEFTHWDNGYIHAIETWTSEQNDRWNLSQVTSLACWQKSMMCWEATAEYHEGSRRLGIDQRFYVIEHWNKTEIVTITDKDNCPVSAVRIDRSKETVKGTRFPNSQEACPHQGSPIALHLTDGYMLWQQAELAKLDRLRPLIQAPGFALPNSSLGCVKRP